MYNVTDSIRKETRQEVDFVLFVTNHTHVLCMSYNNKGDF
jgi:hypothetical protein